MLRNIRDPVVYTVPAVNLTLEGIIAIYEHFLSFLLSFFLSLFFLFVSVSCVTHRKYSIQNKIVEQSHCCVSHLAHSIFPPFLALPQSSI